MAQPGVAANFEGWPLPNGDAQGRGVVCPGRNDPRGEECGRCGNTELAMYIVEKNDRSSCWSGERSVATVGNGMSGPSDMKGHCHAAAAGSASRIHTILGERLGVLASLSWSSQAIKSMATFPVRTAFRVKITAWPREALRGGRTAVRPLMAPLPRTSTERLKEQSG
jgi:hypothetical protein